MRKFSNEMCSFFPLILVLYYLGSNNYMMPSQSISKATLRILIFFIMYLFNNGFYYK